MGFIRTEKARPVDVLTADGVIDILVDDEEEAARVTASISAVSQRALNEWTRADQRILRHMVPRNRKRAFDCIR